MISSLLLSLVTLVSTGDFQPVSQHVHAQPRTVLSCDIPEINLSDLMLKTMRQIDDPLASSYSPQSLTKLSSSIVNPAVPDVYVRSDIVAATNALVAAGAAAGHNFKINSGYRGYDRQARIYANPINAGIAAKPGTSEHQLGTAIDLSVPSPASAAAVNAGYAWLAKNAPSFGFELTYPAGYKSVTGINYEPWHWRYVGTKHSLSTSLFNETTEAFLESPFVSEEFLPHSFHADNLYIAEITAIGHNELVSENFLPNEGVDYWITGVTALIEDEDGIVAVSRDTFYTFTKESTKKRQYGDLVAWEHLGVSEGKDDLHVTLVGREGELPGLIVAYTSKKQQNNPVTFFALNNCVLE